MPSETFFCPRCKRQLTKSAQAYVLGEIMDEKEASFIQMGGLPEFVTCPGCGAFIDTKKMIAGEYDKISGESIGCLGIIAGLVAFSTIDFLGLPWWIGVICGLVVSVLVDRIKAKFHAK